MSIKIRFVTDSVADIPPELQEQWRIGVVPAFVNYGGESYADDRVHLDREQYYKDILDMPELPTTAAPPPSIAQEIVENTFQGADHLIAITTPARLSGIYNAVRLGMQELPHDKVTLIDSGQLSMAMGWQVLIGAETADRTGNLNDTLEAIKRVQNNQSLFAGLATMELLRRSGRVGWASANIGALLQIKPVVSVENGEVSSVARVRTFKRAIASVVDFTQKQAPFDRVAFLHTNNLDAVEDMRQLMSEHLPDTEIITTIANPALGTHIGPGAIGIAVVSQTWKA